MSVIPDLKTLYEVDDSLWLEETIALLKEQKFAALDLDNLIEELEDLGREKKHRVTSLLEQVIIHLLLLQFWQEERDYNQDHWFLEIYTFRTQLNRYLTKNLQKYLEQELPSLYRDASGYVRLKTKNHCSLTDPCPYTLENLLDRDWFPPEEDSDI
jgi:hypothetical protein